LCGSLPERAPLLRELAGFLPSLCAARCRRLLPFVAPKGQEKGNVYSRVPVGAVNCDKSSALTVDPIMEHYGIKKWTFYKRNEAVINRVKRVFKTAW
jgi:hypothetical protein